jgi:hypothetical protein
MLWIKPEYEREYFDLRVTLAHSKQRVDAWSVICKEFPGKQWVKDNLKLHCSCFIQLQKEIVVYTNTHTIPAI